MAMEITNNYSSYSYATQGMAGNSAANRMHKETEGTSETTEGRQSQSTTEYMRELAKLVPSMECRAGNGISSAKKGKTLTIHPKLLEEMQNDPKKEQEMRELIKGVESMTKFMDGMYKASGWSVVYRHGYIDENGKYRESACVRNDFMLHLSDKLREERRKNSERLIEKTKEKVKKKQEELEKKQGLIKGVKPLTRLGGIYKAGGRSVVYRRSYIDENGNYHEITYAKDDYMFNMSDRLREERRKYSEKLIERTKERAAKKKKELEEMLEKKKAAEEQVIEEKAGTRKRTQIGANLDILV